MKACMQTNKLKIVFMIINHQIKIQVITLLVMIVMLITEIHRMHTFIQDIRTKIIILLILVIKELMIIMNTQMMYIIMI